MFKSKKKILVLGASGMLGSTIYQLFSESDDYDVIGTVRSPSTIDLFEIDLQKSIIADIDADNIESIRSLIYKISPEVVINCIGLVKQLSDINDPLVALPINSLLPHELARACSGINARFIHMSTDCVFSGDKGSYTEKDIPDSQDIYGVSKRLGEVDYPNAITLRTSIIGHELNGNRSLVNWFLSQEKEIIGFKRAFFSGLPTIEMARLIRDYVIPNPQLHGIYHVSAEPINKFDLLSLVANIYDKDIKILEDTDFVIDRSLDSSVFRKETGYHPQHWPELIKSMHDFWLNKNRDIQNV